MNQDRAIIDRCVFCGAETPGRPWCMSCLDRARRGLWCAESVIGMYTPARQPLAAPEAPPDRAIDGAPVRSWKLTIRGADRGPMTAEYECPVHGRFKAVVSRDENGDPPAEQPCPAEVSAETNLVQVPAAGVAPAPVRVDQCGIPSPWRISAPGLRFPRSDFRRGKSDPPPHELACDTRDLGEGMPMDEWKAKRAKLWADHDYKTAKEEA